MQSQKTYDVGEFGAMGDGKTDDTAAIQTAIDSCSDEGGGKVLFPFGTYLTRPLILRSGVNLHLEEGSLLLASANPGDYPAWSSKNINPEHGFTPIYNSRFLIIADGEQNISITGKGAINGQGPAHYETEGGRKAIWPIRNIATRPGRMIWFIRCTNVHIEDTTFIDSPAWTFWVLGCDNVTFNGITVRTPYEEIHSDGIDIDCSRNVRVIDCDIKTGDDCIVLRSTNRALRGVKSCEQILVENCRLQSNCNAIRVSHMRDGTIRNAVFRNLVVHNSRRGIICQITAPPNSEPHPWDELNQSGISVPVIENVTFENISVRAIQPLWFYLEDAAIVRRIANICFENISLNGSTANVFKGNENSSLENISLHNIHSTIRNGKTMWGNLSDLPEMALGFEIAHCRNLQISNVITEGQNNTRGSKVPVFYIQKSREIYINQLINDTPNPDTN